MKHMEYVWLASAIFFFAVLVMQYEHLRPVNFAILIGGIVVATFMFTFRRKMRQKQDQVVAEEMQRLEKELEEDNGMETPAEKSTSH